LRFRPAAALIERFGSPPAAGQGPPIGLDDALKPEIAPDGVIQREFGVVVGLLLVVELVVVSSG
jgi:hypothetical protein